MAVVYKYTNLGKFQPKSVWTVRQDRHVGQKLSGQNTRSISEAHGVPVSALNAARKTLGIRPGTTLNDEEAARVLVAAYVILGQRELQAQKDTSGRPSRAKKKDSSCSAECAGSTDLPDPPDTP